jgi:hypothetical protein
VGCVALTLACGGQHHAPVQTGAPLSSAPHAGTAGTALTLNGKPWWPVGLNAYQLATDWTINAGCGAQVNLDDYFGHLPPHSLTRFNAYSSFVVNKHTGQLDFRSLDAVFAAATRHRQLLLPVLTGDEGGCEGNRDKEYNWFDHDWRTMIGVGAPMPFADWLDVAVKRWRDSPALAGWTPVGEPEPSICKTASCDWRERVCPAGSATVLRKFFDVVGARIRELDPGAIIWSGRAGGGQCGTQGDEYQMVSASPGLDVLEVHDYHPLESLPGDRFDGLQRRIAQARAVNKPLVIAEMNLFAGSCLSLTQRARQLNDVVSAQRAAGTAGVLFWSFVPDPRPTECTYDVGPTDPLMNQIGNRAN